MSNRSPFSPGSYAQTAARPRMAGESASDYQRYLQITQGEQARAQATTQGRDTSGMRWDGRRFVDANADHWYSDPRVLGPAAVAAATGVGILAAPAAAGSVAGASTLGGAYGAAAPAITSQAVSGAAGAGAGMWGQVASAGVQTAGNVYGGKKQSQSANRANATQDRANQAAEQEARLQREEDRRRFEIEEANNQRQFAAQEEERAYRRQQDEYQQQLLREREQRQAPYRQMSAAALGNLGHILGIDMGSTPLAQNLSAPRTTAPAPSGGQPPTSGPLTLPPRQTFPGEMNHGSMQGNWQAMSANADPRLDPRRGLPPRRTLGDMTGMGAR